MSDHAKHLLYFFLFLIALFILWAVTGGPEQAKISGSDHNFFQEPLAPIGNGETYSAPVIPSLKK